MRSMADNATPAHTPGRVYPIIGHYLLQNYRGSLQKNQNRSCSTCLASASRIVLHKLYGLSFLLQQSLFVRVQPKIEANLDSGSEFWCSGKLGPWFWSGMEIGLVDLMRAVWLAATLPLLIAFIPSSRLNPFHELVLGFAKRGKILQSSSSKFSVPQKLFWHFYVLAVVWTAILLLATWFYAHNVALLVSEPFQYSTIATHLTGASNIYSSHKSRSRTVKQRYRVWQSVFLLLLMEVQSLRRLYESIHTFKYSPSARMHILGYLAGLFFYAAAPLTLCCTFAPEIFQFAVNHVAEFIVKGKNQMIQIPTAEFDWWVFVSPLMKLQWYSWVGMAIFFWGWIHQRHCHSILGSLRENSEQADEYVIPYGDWFDYVSTPHYLAEIVIYAGLVVASGGTDLTIWLLFGFVVANLVFAAAETHKWYLRKFDNYPRDRFAIIPFVY